MITRPRLYTQLLTGSIVSQSIAGLSILFLSYIYKPSEFGFYSAIIAIAAIMSVLMTVKLEMAINFATTRTKIVKAKDSVLTIVLLFGLILFAINILISLLYSKIVYMAVIPIAIGMSLVATWQSFSIKVDQLSVLNASRIILITSQIVFQIILNNIESGHGIIYGFLLGYIPAVIFLYRKLGFKISNLNTLGSYMSLNIGIIKFTFPAAIVSTISIQILPILILKYFGSDFAGYYGMAYRVIGFPLSIVGVALGQGLIKEVSDDPSKISNYIQSIVLKSSSLGAPILLLLVAMGYLVFTFVIPEWSRSGVLLPILGIAFLFNMITSPISSIPTIINRNEFSLYFTFAELILRPMPIIVLAPHGGLISMLGVSMMTAGLLLIYYTKVTNFLGIDFRAAFKDIFVTLFAAILLFSVSLLILGGQ